MPYFQNADQVKAVIGGFFSQLIVHPTIGKSLRDSKLVLKFIYDEPSLTITADCSQDPIVVTFDDPDKKAEIEMSMKADIAHQFWFGKLNLLTALTRRQMVAKGPIPKILKLLPAIKPAYALYPEYLAAGGHNELML